MTKKLSVFAGTLLAMAVAQVAAACQCAGLSTVAKAQKEAAYVVTGIVTAVHPTVMSSRRLSDDFGEMPLLFPVTKVEIAVTRSFGRPAPKTIELTHIGCCVCEQDLEAGKEYLLFVIRSFNVRDAYMVTFCDPNSPIEKAALLMAQLPAPTRYVPTQTTSLMASMRWRLLGIANHVVAIRYGRARNPFRGVIESPWTPFIAEVAGGIIAALIVIALFRSIHHS